MLCWERKTKAEAIQAGRRPELIPDGESLSAAVPAKQSMIAFSKAVRPGRFLCVYLSLLVIYRSFLTDCL